MFCPRVTSKEALHEALRRDGCCRLQGCGDAAALPRWIFGDALRGHGGAAEVSQRVMATRGIEKEEAFRAHTDGHAYGEAFPDYFLLLCERPCATGGENFLVDGYELLRQLAADPATAWVPRALETTCVQQTSRLRSVSPVALRAGARLALRCRLPGPPSAFAAQRVSEESREPERDKEMLEAQEINASHRFSRRNHN